MSATIVARAKVVYEADENPFVIASRRAEERFDALANKFKNGIRADLSAAKEQARAESEDGGGVGAGIIAAAGLGGGSFAMAAAKTLQTELRAIGQSAFGFGDDQVGELKKQSAKLEEIIKQKNPENLERFSASVAAVSKWGSQASESVEKFFEKVEAKIVEKTASTAAKIREIGKNVNKSHERRFVAGDPSRQRQYDRAAGRMTRNERGQFQTIASRESLTDEERALQDLLQRRARIMERIFKITDRMVTITGRLASVAKSFTEAWPAGLIAVTRVVTYSIQGFAKVGEKIGLIMQFVKNLGRGFKWVVMNTPFSIVLAGAVKLAGPLATIVSHLKATAVASYAAKGAMGALLSLPTGVLLVGLGKLWHSLKSYTDQVQKARRQIGGMEMGKPSILGKAAGAIGIGGASAAGKQGGMGMGMMGGALALGGAGAAVIGLGALMKKTMEDASDYGETANKLGEVFRSEEGNALAYVDSLASKFGAPKKEAAETMTTFAGMFEQTGESSEAIRKMSEQFTQLALDATSFHNVDLKTAQEKLKAGLMGESEPIEAFGVNIKETAVKMEGLRLGFMKNGQEMTESQKIQARASIIMRQMSNATGDLERTLDSPANQMRKLKGTITNLSLSIGEQLQPAFEAGVGFAADIVGWLAQKFEANKEVFGIWVENVRYGINIARDLFGQLPVVWEIVQVRAITAFENTTKVLWYFWDVSKAVALAIAEDFPGTISETFWNIVAIAQNLIHNVKQVFSGGWESISRTVILIFDKLFAKINDMTGGMLSKFMDIKSDGQLESEWKDLQDKFDLKNLTDGTETKHFDRLKKAFNDVPFPEFVNSDEEVAKLTDKLGLGLTDAAAKAAQKEEEARAAKKKAAEAKPETMATPEAPTKEIKVSIKSADEFSRNFSDSLLGQGQKEDKKQTEYLRQLAENAKENKIAARRREARSNQVVTAK